MNSVNQGYTHSPYSVTPPKYDASHKFVDETVSEQCTAIQRLANRLGPLQHPPHVHSSCFSCLEEILSDHDKNIFSIVQIVNSQIKTLGQQEHLPTVLFNCTTAEATTYSIGELLLDHAQAIEQINNTLDALDKISPPTPLVETVKKIQESIDLLGEATKTLIAMTDKMNQRIERIEKRVGILEASLPH